MSTMLPRISSDFPNGNRSETLCQYIVPLIYWHTSGCDPGESEQHCVQFNQLIQ